LDESATYSKPVKPTVMPCGALKEASTPQPSANAHLPLPARVLTAALRGSTARTRQYEESVTKRRPLRGSATMPRGVANAAAVPTPSARWLTAALPAKLETAPEETVRSKWLSASTIKAASPAPPNVSFNATPLG
jgi:hypothetical protein